MIIFMMLLEKFNNKIDESNIKTFIKTLRKLEDEQHKIFLEEFEKKMENTDKKTWRARKTKNFKRFGWVVIWKNSFLKVKIF